MSHEPATLTKWRRFQNADQEGADDRRMSFSALGLEPHFVKAMRTAFPDVLEPTRVQCELIPEVLGNRDIVLKDVTGSGKTFGLVLGLLNKQRMVIHDEGEEGRRRRAVTTLFIVPHRDLAHQIMHWIERLWKELKPSPPLSSIAQVLVRGGGVKTKDGITGLRKTPPHVLICTPEALWDVYMEDKEALQLETLRTVVVDEVDYLVETEARKYRKHPGRTREMLDVIYRERKEGREREEREMPQLIVSSATLRVQFRKELIEKSGWMKMGKMVKISGEKEGRGSVRHSILVLTGKGVRNVEGAVEGEEAREMEMETGEDAQEEGGLCQTSTPSEYRHTPSPFRAEALEAVATAFALDVPSTALLVLPSSAPVQRAVYELRELGVEAEGLDVRKEAGGERRSAGPRLLVGTVATTRGVDLPWLTHVFILGVAEGRTVDWYTHIAGRVGRFGRAGRVLTLVTPAETTRMLAVLKSLRKHPVRFQHFH